MMLWAYHSECSETQESFQEESHSNHLARHIRSFALGNPGREQLAMEAYHGTLSK